jgi:hypothetical protein
MAEEVCDQTLEGLNIELLFHLEGIALGLWRINQGKSVTL